MAEPFYQDDAVKLYLGDCRDVLQDVHDWADAVIADPPYGETSLPWDRWPERWPLLMTWHTTSMWCFGSFRMFTDRWPEFTGWKLSQDIVWEKHNGTGFANDRFKRVHEHAVHMYHGSWSDVYHQTPKAPYAGSRKPHVRRTSREGQLHTGDIGENTYIDDGTRLVRSVIKAPSVRGRFHPTQKPDALLRHMIEYSVPPGGLVLDPFAGSGQTGITAVQMGRRALLVEADEAYAEVIAKRLENGVQVDLGGDSDVA